MTDNRTVSLTISLPKHHRDLVRIKAAEYNLGHPEGVITGAGIVRDIIVEYLDEWEKNQLSPSDKENEDKSQAKEKTP